MYTNNNQNRSGQPVTFGNQPVTFGSQPVTFGGQPSSHTTATFNTSQPPITHTTTNYNTQHLNTNSYQPVPTNTTYLNDGRRYDDNVAVHRQDNHTNVNQYDNAYAAQRYDNVHTTSQHHDNVHVDRREEPIVQATSSDVHRVGAYDSQNRGTELRRSNVRESRFKDYQKRRPEYKYNLFSLIDEPWNRCCQIGKCGTCPGNQCIARREPKLDWL